MSYLDLFDAAVDKNCGRLTIQQRGKTGYYRKTDMDRAYKELYKNPTIQAKFGGGVMKMKQKAEDVFQKSFVSGGVAVGDILPPIFNSRRYNLGTSVGSMSMFSADSLDSETRSERMGRMGFEMADFESQISEDASYWSNPFGGFTQSEMEFAEEEMINADLNADADTDIVREEEYIRERPDRSRELLQRRDIMIRRQEEGDVADYRQQRALNWIDIEGGRQSFMPRTADRNVAQPYSERQPIGGIQQDGVPEQAVPAADAINQQPRARM